MDEDSTPLPWLRVLTIMAGVLWIVAGLKRLAVASFGMEHVLADAGLNALLCTSLFFLTWLGLRKRMPAFVQLETPIAVVTSAARYARSALDAASRERVADDLVRLMRERHLYADAQLDLAALSRHSGWSPAYISQALESASAGRTLQNSSAVSASMRRSAALPIHANAAACWRLR